MKTIYTYYKNSNTNELIQKQEFTETAINFPIHYYDENGNEIVDISLTGYVEISAKTFRILLRRLKRPL